jgi:hypothetical protein
MRDQHAHLRTLLDARLRRFRVLELQAAQLGPTAAPAHLLVELDELRQEIAQLQEAIAAAAQQVQALGHEQSGVQRSGIFISYSHNDRRWLEKLQLMLKPLVRANALAFWDDTQIRPGARWRDEIAAAIAAARVALLLVSPSFLDSDFIAENELPPLLEAAERRGLTIFWVAVSASMYRATALAGYQAANDPQRPLDSLRPAALNKELVRICEQVALAAVEAPGQIGEAPQ